ncbi:MAG: hypothetical protein JRF08_00085 [Deltaproteobacteria bacterium]|nr:hypothetical protein [Deltaproteobacteria bacterium]MBW2105158.1 hypothetical protein [Deltaproteobacteria bacterium]MBW2331894.1 hypothetical protein [Deltaproteobacteria bacterium]MCD6265906.1 hypothetical protein [Deltaproteobacteria bacterium]
MKENSMVQLFVRNLVMAIPWGIILLLVVFIAAVGIKQQVKEAMQYGIRTAIYTTGNFAFDYNTIVPVKQNIKEGVEFVAKTTKNEIKNLLDDPQVKNDLKEIFEYSCQGKQ